MSSPASPAENVAVRRLIEFGRALLPLKMMLGAGLMLLLVVVAAAAPLIAPFDPDQQNLRMALRAPQWFAGNHFLGTDHLGRDILSRIIYGARVSVAIAILAFLGQGLFILILALVSQRWIPYCRVARAQALSLRERDFVMAARSLGARNSRIIRHHIVPNLLQSGLVIGTFAMAGAILSEASLSFLGLGVPAEIPTWGAMLADGRSHISTSWWLALFPGLAIFFTVLGINLLGDALRDVLDPRLKRSGER